MKRLLFFASDFKIGLSQVLADQLKSLHDGGADYIAVAGENEQEPGLSDRLMNSRIKLMRINGLDTHKDFKRLVKSIATIIKENNIGVVHVQNNWQLALVFAAKKVTSLFHGPDIVYTIHGFRNNNPHKAVIARMIIGCGLLIMADKVICMTDYLKNKFGIVSRKTVQLYLGVDDNFFLKAFKAPQIDHLRIIFPAQFRVGKNQDMIVKAFADFVKISGDDNAGLLLPGGGDTEPVRRLAKNLGIGDLVSFPGLLTKEQIKEAYLNSNIAVVASNSETFGQSIVEPYVLGRCVLSTPVGIAPEIIHDGENGWIFNSPEELTRIFLNLDKNKNRLVAIGKNNYGGRDIFSWARITEQYLSSILSI